MVVAVLGCVMVAEVAVATSAGATLLVRNDAPPARGLTAATVAVRPSTTTTTRPHLPRAVRSAPRPTTRAVPPHTTTASHPARPAPRRAPAPAPKAKPAAPAHLTATPTAAPGPPGCPGALAGIVWPSTWRVVCQGGRSGVLGLTYPNGVTYLYVRADESASYLRIVALHEAGHAWDFARLDPAKIARWCAARGCDAAHFFSGGSSRSGYREPGGAEDWAASWDACHGGSYHRSYLGFGPPSAAQCALQNALTGYPG